MEGLIGLSQNVNNTQSAMRDLSVLERMENRMQQDKQSELLAQQQQEALMERAYQMSDQLLEKDRMRINKKIRMAQGQIQNNLRDIGGSRADFMADGGLSVLNKITNDIMRSDEAVRYQENKMNLAKIYEAQEKGLGHRINPKDLQTLQDYEAGKEGVKITYSGMMNEIVIPPTNDFEWGHQATPSEVLNYDKNYAKIVQDYETYHGEPPMDDSRSTMDEKLEAYVKMRGYTVRGTNLQVAQLRMQERKLQAERNKTKQETPRNSVIAKYINLTAQADGISYADLIGEKYKGSYWNTVRKNSDGSDNAGVNQYYKEKSPVIGFTKNGEIKGEISTSDKLKNLMDKAAMLGFGGNKSRDYNPLFEFNNENYAIADSFITLKGYEPDIVKAVLGNEDVGGYKIANNKVLDYTPQTTDFSSNGTSLNSKDMDLKSLKGNYNIEKVVTGWVGTDQDGKPQIITNIVDDKGNVDPEKNKLIQEGNLGREGSDQLSAKTFIALKEEESGSVIYREVDMASESVLSVIRQALGAKDNVHQQNEDQNKLVRQQQILKQFSGSEAQVAREGKEAVKHVYENNSNFQQESSQFYGANSAGASNRDNMMKAFYGALNFTINQKNNPNGIGEYTISSGDPQKPFGIKDLVNNQSFTLYAKQGGIFEALRDYKGDNPYQIINKWLQTMNDDNDLGTDLKTGNENFAREWERHMAIYETN